MTLVFVILILFFSVLMIYSVYLLFLLIQSALLLKIDPRHHLKPKFSRLFSVISNRSQFDEDIKQVLINSLELDVDRAEHLLSILKSAGFTSANDLCVFGRDFIDRPEVLSNVLKQDFEMNSIDAHQLRAAIMSLVHSKTTKSDKHLTPAINLLTPTSTEVNTNTPLSHIPYQIITNATLSTNTKPHNMPIFKKFTLMPDKSHDTKLSHTSSSSKLDNYGVTKANLSPKIQSELDSFYTVSLSSIYASSLVYVRLLLYMHVCISL